MCVEACASGRPVFLFQPAAATPAKLARLHRSLGRGGYLRPLGAPWPARAPPPLDPAADVAQAIRARLGRIGAAAPLAVASGLQTA
jgi:mitochondrial fission protein ELM1